jgi:periplasmic copper chaperone A
MAWSPTFSILKIFGLDQGRPSTIQQETGHALKRPDSGTVGARAPVVGFDPGGQFSGGLPEKRAVFAIAASPRRGQPLRQPVTTVNAGPRFAATIAGVDCVECIEPNPMSIHPSLHRSSLWLVAAAWIIVSLVHVAVASDCRVGSISIEQPWSRATPGGAQVAVGYLTIKNEGTTEDRLVSVTAEIASRAEIHQMTMADDVMKMRQVTDGLPVPANGSVVLDPNTYHLMFMELKRQLKEGEHFSGTLTFEKAGTVDVTFDVEGVGATGPKPTERDHQ